MYLFPATLQQSKWWFFPNFLDLIYLLLAAFHYNCLWKQQSNWILSFSSKWKTSSKWWMETCPNQPVKVHQLERRRSSLDSCCFVMTHKTCHLLVDVNSPSLANLKVCKRDITLPLGFERGWVFLSKEAAMWTGVCEAELKICFISVDHGMVSDWHNLNVAWDSPSWTLLDLGLISGNTCKSSC